MNKAATVLTAAVLALAVLQNATNAASVVGIDPSEGVTNDLFDVSNGTVVTAFSPQCFYSNTGTSDARSAFGYSSSFIEPPRAIFNDQSPIPTDFIEFHTSQPIDPGSYKLTLGSDEPGRWIKAFRLYASDNSSDVLSHLISAASIAGPYVANYGKPTLEVSDQVNVLNVQYFRMEVDRGTFSGFSGPRIIEPDGFAPVPEQSSVVLSFVGILSAGIYGWRKRGSRAKAASLIRSQSRNRIR